MFPLLKFILAPLAKNKSDHINEDVPRALPFDTAGDSAVDVNCTSAAEFIARPRVLEAGKYKPFVGIVEEFGINELPVIVVPVTAAGLVPPITTPLIVPLVAAISVSRYSFCIRVLAIFKLN